MDRSVSTLLAGEILQAFATTAEGHCARVDYLSRELAEALCASIAAQPASTPIACHVLVARDDASTSRWAITSDRAIELRNRKAVRLCLFVPSDLIDAAVSSLANAFALLDGRDLQRRAADRLLAGLPRQAQTLVRAILRQVRAPLLLEPSRRLDILAAAARHADAGTSARLGGELWRIGLIADAGDDFATRLERNRTMVRGLAHPRRLHASVDERLRSL